MALPTELRGPDDEPPPEYQFRQGLPGKFDIAALLEDQLQLLPEGLDPEGTDPALLDHLFASARAQSEAGFPHLRPCRDPTKDHLLASLHAAETRNPRTYAALLEALLILNCILQVATLGLNAAVVWALWSYGPRSLFIAAAVLLLLQLPVTSLVLGLQLGNHHRITAWFAIPLYDLACLLALPLLQRQPLAERRRLTRRFPRFSEVEIWLWQYRACRQVMLVVLHSLPMAILDIVACVDLEVVSKGSYSEGGLPASAVAVLLAGAVVSALHAAQTLADAALNARWSGQMPLLSYMALALQLRGSRKLPYDWEALLAERRIVIKPDSPEFFELNRPQQCQVLRLALQRPHFAISNVVTHPRPPPKAPPRDGAGSRRTSAIEREKEAEDGASGGGGCRWFATKALSAAAAASQRVGEAVEAACGRVPGCGSWLASRQRRRRRRPSGTDSDEEAGGGRPQAPPSACLLLQSKSAVKSAVGLLPGPLAAAHRSLVDGEFSVNLVSFTDAASCKHCKTLLELVIRQGLRSLMICDAKLPLDFFGVFTSYLPSPNCLLTKLVLKDVMASGISTLCMLCNGMQSNSSVTHLDMSNNQLWGLRGAKELRTMLRGNGGLKVLLLPFCNIASLGAVEIFKGIAENATLEHLDLSQNHIGDDVPDWSDVRLLRNTGLKEVDLSFNWIQDSLAGWTAALLEAFPTLTRLHLNHNSDTANSRVASRAATPKIMTPRTLTPRTLTPSNLRIASYGQSVLAAAAAAAAGLAAPVASSVAAPTSSGAGTGPAQWGPSSASPSPLQGQQLPSSYTMLSPSVSGRLDAPPGGGPGQVTATGLPVGSAPPSPPQVQQGRAPSSLMSLGPHAHAGGELPGRSRGHHLLAHLEMYQMTTPLRRVRTTGFGSGGAAAAAGRAASGAVASSQAGSRDVGRRSLGRDSQAVPRGGSSMPSLALLQTQSSAAAIMAAGTRRLSGGSWRMSGRPVSQPPPSGSGGCGGGRGAGAGSGGFGGGNLWAAVAGMERLDLRGMAMPSWWARSQVLRPASVLVDEALVYEEPAPPGLSTSLATGGMTSGGFGGGLGGFGGGWLELPAHVIRALEAGLAQGVLVIDLNAPEYKSIGRFQQLVAIYVALQHATHVTISNTPRSLGSGVHNQSAFGQGAAAGGGAGGSGHASGNMFSLVGGGPSGAVAGGGGGGLLQHLGSGLGLMRSSTSSFPLNSGTAAFVTTGGGMAGGAGGGGAGGGTAAAARLVSETGYLAGAIGGGGGGGPNGGNSPRLPLSQAAARASAGATPSGPASMQRFGSFRGATSAAGAYASGAPLLPAASQHHAAALLTSADIGACGGAGRPSVPRRVVAHDSSVSSLHRFALERGGNSFSTTTSTPTAAAVAAVADGAAGGGGRGGAGLARSSASIHPSAARSAQGGRGFYKQYSLRNPATGGPLHHNHHQPNPQHPKLHQQLVHQHQGAQARRSRPLNAAGAGSHVSVASGAVAEAVRTLGGAGSASARHVELASMDYANMSAASEAAALTAPSVAAGPSLGPGGHSSVSTAAAVATTLAKTTSMSAPLVTAALPHTHTDSHQYGNTCAGPQQNPQYDGQRSAEEGSLPRPPAVAAASADPDRMRQLVGKSASRLEGLYVLGPGVSGTCSSSLSAPQSGGVDDEDGRAGPSLGLPDERIGEAASGNARDVKKAAMAGATPPGGRGGGGGGVAMSVGLARDASGHSDADVGVGHSARFQDTIARMLLDEDDTDPPTRSGTPSALMNTMTDDGPTRTGTGLSTQHMSNCTLASSGPSPCTTVSAPPVLAAAAATAAAAGGITSSSSDAQYSPRAVAEATSHCGSGGNSGDRRLAPPLSAAAHLAGLPASSSRRRKPGDVADPLVQGDMSIGDAGSSVRGARRGSGGSGISSLVLAEGMAGEMWDAGVAILRAASGEAPPVAAPVAPDAKPRAGRGTTPFDAIPSSTAGTPLAHAPPGDPLLGVATAPPQPSTSPGQSNAAVLILPSGTAPLPNSQFPSTPSVGAREGPRHSFSFTPFRRMSSDGQSRNSPATPAVTKAPARPTSPLGPGSRPSPTQPLDASTNRRTGSSPGASEKAGLGVLRYNALERGHAARPSPTAANSNGAICVGGGRGSRGGEEYAFPEAEEDLEVSFRVDGATFGALPGLRDALTGLTVPQLPATEVRELAPGLYGSASSQSGPLLVATLTPPTAATSATAPMASGKGSPGSGTPAATALRLLERLVAPGPAAGTGGVGGIKSSSSMAVNARGDGESRAGSGDGAGRNGRAVESRPRGDDEEQPLASDLTTAAEGRGGAGQAGPVESPLNDLMLKAAGPTAVVPGRVMDGGGNGPPDSWSNADRGPAPPSQANIPESPEPSSITGDPVTDLAEGDAGSPPWLQTLAPSQAVPAHPGLLPYNPVNLFPQPHAHHHHFHHHHPRHHSATPTMLSYGATLPQQQTDPAAFAAGGSTFIGTAPGSLTGSPTFGAGAGGAMAAAAAGGGHRGAGHHCVANMFYRPRSAFVAGPPSETNETASAVDPVEPFAADGGPDLLLDSATVGAGGASVNGLLSPAGPRGNPRGTGRLGFLGVEASNAVSVVILVGCDGQLRVPLRCLELPLRGTMARRPGLTVSFRLTGLSHDGMRQLKALMSVAKVPMPERSHAWLLPSQSQHIGSANGMLPPNGVPSASNASGAASQALPTAQSLGLGFINSGYNTLTQALAAGGGAAGPGSAYGPLGSRAFSRLDSGGTRDLYGYSHLPSYYLDNRGQPIDLGFILPPPTDSAEPSGCQSMCYSTAATPQPGMYQPGQLQPPQLYQGALARQSFPAGPGGAGLGPGAGAVGGGSGGLCTGNSLGAGTLQSAGASQDQQQQQQVLSSAALRQAPSVVASGGIAAPAAAYGLGGGGGAVWDAPAPPGVPSGALEGLQGGAQVQAACGAESDRAPEAADGAQQRGLQADYAEADPREVRRSSAPLPKISEAALFYESASPGCGATSICTGRAGVASHSAFHNGAAVPATAPYGTLGRRASRGEVDVAGSAGGGGDPGWRHSHGAPVPGGGNGGAGQALNLPQGVMLVNLPLRNHIATGGVTTAARSAANRRANTTASSIGGGAGDGGGDEDGDADGMSLSGGSGVPFDSGLLAAAAAAAGSQLPDDDVPQFIGTLKGTGKTATLQTGRSGAAAATAAGCGGGGFTCSGCGGLARGSFSAFGRLSIATSSGVGDSTATGTPPPGSHALAGGAFTGSTGNTGTGLAVRLSGTGTVFDGSGFTPGLYSPSGSLRSPMLTTLGVAGSMTHGPQDAGGASQGSGEREVGSKCHVMAFGSTIDVGNSGQQLAAEMLGEAGLPSGADGMSGHVSGLKLQGSLCLLGSSGSGSVRAGTGQGSAHSQSQGQTHSGPLPVLQQPSVRPAGTQQQQQQQQAQLRNQSAPQQLLSHSGAYFGGSLDAAVGGVGPLGAGAIGSGAGGFIRANSGQRAGGQQLSQPQPGSAQGATRMVAIPESRPLPRVELGKGPGTPGAERDRNLGAPSRPGTAGSRGGGEGASRS